MSGKIVFVGIKPKHALENMVRREVDRWVAKERRTYPPEPASYEVKVSCENTDHFYYCRIDAEIGGCRWLANEGGRTLLDALAKTLKRMKVHPPKPSSMPRQTHFEAAIA